MKFAKTALVSALLLASGTALANESSNGVYFGANASNLTYSEEGLGDDLSLLSLSGKLGRKFNENISLEARFGFGLGDDSTTVYGTTVDLELNSFYGAYLKAGIPASDTFSPYAVLGYTKGELTAKAGGMDFTESESDMSMGIGADFKLDALNLNVEYMNYIDKDGVEIGGISIGFVSYF